MKVSSLWKELAVKLPDSGKPLTYYPRFYVAVCHSMQAIPRAWEEALNDSEAHSVVLINWEEQIITVMVVEHLVQ